MVILVCSGDGARYCLLSLQFLNISTFLYLVSLSRHFGLDSGHAFLLFLYKPHAWSKYQEEEEGEELGSTMSLLIFLLIVVLTHGTGELIILIGNFIGLVFPKNINF